MRAKGNATSAMDAHIGETIWVEKNGLNRTGFSALAAAGAEVKLDFYATSLALQVGTCGASLSARSRVAG